MPEQTLVVPWNTKAVAFRLAVYAVTLTLLLVVSLRLGEWGEAGWVVVAAGGLILLRASRLRDLARQGGNCMELTADGVTLNGFKSPVTIPWSAAHSCEKAATHTMVRSDSLVLLIHDDRLPASVDPALARPFPRVPGTRALRIDCTFAAMDQAALLAEFNRRIENAR